MIPVADVIPEVQSPLPTCTMPKADEVTEEGFGFFRNTWWVGRVFVKEAQATTSEEGELIRIIDEVTSTPEEFELLASAVEGPDIGSLPDALRVAALATGLGSLVSDDDFPPLNGLEVGVAGLAHALAATGCVTAASCRWHISSETWSDCPVVFFVAPAWRVEILAELVSAEGCGLKEDRDMLKIYGSSIRATHTLAERILAERGRFRKAPERWRRRVSTSRENGREQLDLLTEPRP